MLLAARNVLGVALLVGLAILTWVLSRPYVPESRPERAAAGAGTSYYLRNATLFGTDAEGRIYYRLHAAGIEKPADGGALEFRDLTLDYDPAFDVHWRLTAAAGRTGDSTETLLLSKGVRLESVPGGEIEATTVEAESLTLDAAASVATTPDRVSLTHGRTRFEATGLTADLSADRMDLHADVSAEVHR